MSIIDLTNIKYLAIELTSDEMEDIVDSVNSINDYDRQRGLQGTKTIGGVMQEWINDSYTERYIKYIDVYKHIYLIDRLDIEDIDTNNIVLFETNAGVSFSDIVRLLHNVTGKEQPNTIFNLVLYDTKYDTLYISVGNKSLKRYEQDTIDSFDSSIRRNVQ